MSSLLLGQWADWMDSPVVVGFFRHLEEKNMTRETIRHYCSAAWTAMQVEPALHVLSTLEPGELKERTGVKNRSTFKTGVRAFQDYLQQTGVTA